MKLIAISFSLGLAVLFASTGCGQNKPSVQIEATVVDLQPTAFMKAIDGGNLVLLDVRTPEEYAGGFIEGARNLDYFGSDFEKELAKFNKEIPVYVYCASGGRSEAAAEDLIKKSLKKVYNLAGGIEAWQDEKLQVTHP